MDAYTCEELAEAAQIVSSLIRRCEKMQPTFAEGTSQHSLLKNRIKALSVSKSIIAGENDNAFTKNDLLQALKPIASIINKCEKAKNKFLEGSSQYTRLQNMLTTMYISQSLITDEIHHRG